MSESEHPQQGQRIRTAVIGAGVIAQVMHIPYLRELDDRFELVAVCDLSPARAASARRHWPEAEVDADWRQTLERDVDAVLILTPGNHAPIALAAAERGLHAFVEKPFCYSVAEAEAIVSAMRSRGRTLMLGYMKRYDPAYEALQGAIAGRDDIRLARVTTLEAPFEPYIEHYALEAADDAEPARLEAVLRKDRRLFDEALGRFADDQLLRQVFSEILLLNLVHELSALRGLIGAPTRIHAAIAGKDARSFSLSLAYGDIQCSLNWVDLPGLTKYEQEFAFYAPDDRWRLVFPSPYLRSMPTRLVHEFGDRDSPASHSDVLTAGFDEAFKRELREFHDCVVSGRTPRTPGEEGLADIQLLHEILIATAEGGARDL